MSAVLSCTTAVASQATYMLLRQIRFYTIDCQEVCRCVAVAPTGEVMQPRQFGIRACLEELGHQRGVHLVLTQQGMTVI